MNQLELKRKRAIENHDLVKRMKAGDRLTSFDAMSSWFPPRPLIQKDKDAIRRLEGKSK